MGWTLIEHQALTSSVASVTLGSGGTLPQTYKTLKVVASLRSNGASEGNELIALTLNGSATNYSRVALQGNGSTVISATGPSTYIRIASGMSNGVTSNTFGSVEVTIPNYAGSTNKPLSADAVSENNATQAYQYLVAGLWSNTSAITSITINPIDGTSFLTGCTVTLYGLA